MTCENLVLLHFSPLYFFPPFFSDTLMAFPSI